MFSKKTFTLQKRGEEEGIPRWECKVFKSSSVVDFFVWKQNVKLSILSSNLENFHHPPNLESHPSSPSCVVKVSHSVTAVSQRIQADCNRICEPLKSQLTKKQTQLGGRFKNTPNYSPNGGNVLHMLFLKVAAKASDCIR